MWFSSEETPSLDADHVIEVKGVSKAYHVYDRPQDRLLQMLFRKPRGQALTVLHDISLEVRRGETIGVIGRNGAGKSTLLQLIAGTLQPTAGTIVTRGRIAPLIELGSGFNPELTGRENVIFNGMILGMPEEEVLSKFDKIAAFADIGDYLDRPVKTYSSGMHARLAFAVAVHIDPEILIVDEILSVGDAGFQRKCMKRFYDIRDTGCTILLVAHDEYLIRSICQKAIYLKEGRMMAFGEPAEVVSHYMNDVLPQALTPEPEAVIELAVVPETVALAPIEEPSPCIPEAVVATQEPEVALKEDPALLFRFTDIALRDAKGALTDVVKQGDTIKLEFDFKAVSSEAPEKISFVFNLYTADGIYVCGSTTLMDRLGACQNMREGRVSITFPNLPLLARKYVWRIAINDYNGLHVLHEAKGVCPFRVIDDYPAAGLVDLERSWAFSFAAATAKV